MKHPLLRRLIKPKAKLSMAGLGKVSFSKAQLLVFVLVFGGVGGYFLVSGQAAGNTANIWIDTNGGSCTRSATPAAYNDATACGSFDAAYQAASPGDLVLVQSGSYGSQTVNSKTGAAAPNVVIGSATGASVALTGLSLGNSSNGPSYLTVKGPMAINESSASVGMQNTNHVTFDNLTINAGGANIGNVMVYLGDTSNSTISNSNIGNVLNQMGILIDGGSTTNVTLDHNYLHDINSIAGSGVHDEAVFVNGGIGIVITRNNFWNGGTTADLTITRTNTGVTAPTNLEIDNNIFGPADNIYSIQQGSGGLGTPVTNETFRNNLFLSPFVFNEQPSGLTMTGNIGVNGGCEAGGTYSYNIWDGVACSATDSQNANILSLSYYVNPGSYARGSTPGDWHYSSTNPAIGHGNPSNYPSIDLDGNTRPVDVVDAGPYEYNAGNQWAGKFNCYANPTSGCWTPATCSVTAADSNTADLQNKINTATAGQVICGTGTYGPIATSKVNSSDVIIQSVDPNNPMSLAGVTLAGAGHWKFQGIHFTGDNQIAASTNITFTHNLHETGQLSLCSAPNCTYDQGGNLPNENILIDHDEFTNYNYPLNSGHEGRIEVEGAWSNGGLTTDHTPNGVVIQYSLFKDGAPNSCSDGVQFVQEAQGTIIRYNEFADMTQGSCQTINGAHVDPIQDVGSYGTLVESNYFHQTGDGSGGIEAFNGCSHFTATNNVIVNPGYARSIAFGYADHADHCVATHNTMVQLLSVGITGDVGSGNSSTNNVMAAYYPNEKFVDNDDYNLCFDSTYQSNCTGSHDLRPSATSVIYQGGASPTDYYGWQLAPGSPGYNAGSDGYSMGIYNFNGSSGGGSTDTTPPSVGMSSPAGGSGVSGSVTVSASATDNVAISSVQFKLDGNNLGSAITTPTSGSTYSISWNSSQSTNGSHTLAAVACDTSYNCTTSTAITVTVSGGTSLLNFGEINVLPSADSGNSNLLVAQSANLTQAGSLKSLSFYVTAAAGSLRLGVYNNSGPSGGPGSLLAQTASLVPTTGWNTSNTTTNPQLSAGTYWLAYLPSDNNLAFVKSTDASSSGKYYTYAFGALPATFSTSPTTTASHWSLYATVDTSGTCPSGDLNSDCHVTITDLSILLSSWGSTTNAACDLNSNGTVDIFDLSILLSHYGM